MKLDGSLERTADGSYVVTFDRVMDRSPEDIWSTLTDPERLARWLGEVQVDLRVGGVFIIHFRSPSSEGAAGACNSIMTGQITALEPGCVIEYSWLEDHGMPSSVVRWEIVPLAAGCRLRLTHRFPPGCQLKNLTSFLGGWHAFMDAIPIAAAGTCVPYADETALASGYRERYGNE